MQRCSGRWTSSDSHWASGRSDNGAALTQEQLGSNGPCVRVGHLSDRARPGRSRSGAHAEFAWRPRSTRESMSDCCGKARDSTDCSTLVMRDSSTWSSPSSSRTPGKSRPRSRSTSTANEVRSTSSPSTRRQDPCSSSRSSRSCQTCNRCLPALDRKGASRPRCRRRARLGVTSVVQTPRSAERSDGSAPGRGARGDIPDSVSGSDEGVRSVVAIRPAAAIHGVMFVSDLRQAATTSTRSSVSGRRPMSASTSRCVRLIESVPDLRAEEILSRIQVASSPPDGKSVTTSLRRLRAGTSACPQGPAASTGIERPAVTRGPSCCARNGGLDLLELALDGLLLGRALGALGTVRHRRHRHRRRSRPRTRCRTPRPADAAAW